MRSVILACWFIATIMGPADANEGDVFDCSVRDFVNASQTGDTAFIAANKAKAFEVREYGDKFTINAKSETFEPSSEDYLIRSRSLLQVSAVSDGSSFLTTFTIAVDAGDEAPLEASIVFQGPYIANVWFLSCKRRLS